MAEKVEIMEKSESEAPINNSENPQFLLNQSTTVIKDGSNIVVNESKTLSVNEDKVSLNEGQSLTGEASQIFGILAGENQPSDENTVSNENSDSPKSLEALLKRFKRVSSGIIPEVRKREAYRSNSVKRKEKSKQARKRKKNSRYGSGRW